MKIFKLYSVNLEKPQMYYVDHSSSSCRPSPSTRRPAVVHSSPKKPLVVFVAPVVHSSRLLQLPKIKFAQQKNSPTWAKKYSPKWVVLSPKWVFAQMGFAQVGCSLSFIFNFLSYHVNPTVDNSTKNCRRVVRAKKIRRVVFRRVVWIPRNYNECV